MEKFIKKKQKIRNHNLGSPEHSKNSIKTGANSMEWHQITLTTKQVEILIQALNDSISGLSWVDRKEEINEEIFPLINYLEAGLAEKCIKDLPSIQNDTMEVNKHGKKLRVSIDDYEENYFTCNYCENDYHNEESNYFEDSDFGYQRLVCKTCYQKLKETV